MHARLVFVMILLGMDTPSIAVISAYTNKQLWQTAISGPFASVDFTGFPDGTLISDQYHDVGVTVSGFAQIFQSNGFVNDGWGLHGSNGLRFTFDSPQNWVAVDYSGAVRFNLFTNGSLIYTSAFFQPGGFGNFAGIVSDVRFDEVYLDKGPPGPNSIFIDDLYFGPPIPGPGVLGVFAVAAARSCRRHRRV